MSRFFTPLVFFAVAAGVHWHNSQGGAETIAFPFVELLVPSTKGDHAAMGRVSVQILTGVGALMTLKSLVSLLRERAED
ncbi:MAG: hypothetical protein H6741_15960 [Alphaproteobacteria bacterium]|nr:hypothetical protein [Alphaproteobacteria bacterium]